MSPASRKALWIHLHVYRQDRKTEKTWGNKRCAGYVSVHAAMPVIYNFTTRWRQLLHFKNVYYQSYILQYKFFDYKLYTFHKNVAMSAVGMENIGNIQVSLKETPSDSEVTEV